jgi:ketosteroid isomerase-like protein
MAVIAEVTLRGITEEQYDAVRARSGWLQRPPDGGLGHLAWWEGADCHNADAWESEEAFAAFGEQRLGPAMAAEGIDVPVEVTFHPAHEVNLPRRAIVTATPADIAAADNVALTRSGYASFTAGDIPAVLALFDEDLVWSTQPSVSFGGVYHGPQGAAEFFTRLQQNVAELRVEPERFIDVGDTVVVQGTHRGRAISGNAFEVAYVHVWTWRGGKATSFTEVMDTAPLAAALGEVIPAQRSAPALSGHGAPRTAVTGEKGSIAMSDVEATLRRMFDEIINQGRLEAADEYFAEDFVDHGPMGELRGREAFKQMVARWREAVPDVHCDVYNVVADGDRCAWLVRTTGTHTGNGLGFPATGKRFETVSANIGRFRDGRAAEHWSEQGLFPLLVQIGVLSVPAPAGV